MMKTKILTLFLLLGLALSASAQSVKELQQQQRKLQEEIENTNKMLKQTKRNETATENKLALLSQNIKTQRKLVASLGNEITALDRETEQLLRQRDTLQNELVRLRRDYARLVRETHYAQMQQSPLLFVLSAESFHQLIRRIRYLQEFQSFRRKQAERIRNTQQEIDTQNEALQEHKKEKTAALKAQKRQQESLARDEKKQKNMLKELKNQEKTLAAQQKKQQKKADELNKKINDMIRKQAQKQGNQLTQEQQLVSGGFEKNKGRLPWPIEKGFISGYYGKHQHPVYEHVTIDNQGIFLQASAGSIARAVYEGEVTSCFQLNNTYTVIVQHGNYRTVYAGLSKLSVKQGDKVNAKQKLGTIYTDTEQDNKTEIQFRIYNGKDTVNPQLWLAQ